MIAELLFGVLLVFGIFLFWHSAEKKIDPTSLDIRPDGTFTIKDKDRVPTYFPKPSELIVGHGTSRLRSAFIGFTAPLFHLPSALAPALLGLARMIWIFLKVLGTLLVGIPCLMVLGLMGRLDGVQLPPNSRIVNIEHRRAGE